MCIRDRNVEILGNKVLLEKRLNIRASDYRFVDKVKYYKGFTTANADKIGYVLKRQCTVVRRMLPFTDFRICGVLGIDFDEHAVEQYPCNDEITAWTQTRLPDGTIHRP